MNINDFVASNSARTYLGLQSGTPYSPYTSKVSSASQAGLQKIETRLQSEVDVTSAQLSSFGQLQSSVSSVQMAAKSLGSVTAKSSTADVKTAADKFVSTFNAAISAAKTTANVPGEMASTQRATRVGRDLGGAVSDNTATFDALKNIGFNMQSDGTVTLDAKKFEAAQKADLTSVKSTLANLGQQVDKTATQELATSGNVGHSMTWLNQRAAILQNQKSMVAALQQTATQSNTHSMYGSFGLPAYTSY
jgi:hypothetical protein